MRKNISQLLPALAHHIILPTPQPAETYLHTPITALCYDSRKAHDMTLFFCLPGALTDGHKYAPAAYASGTRAFIVERPLDLPPDALQIQVPDTRLALADAAAEFYDHPEREMRLVGITGTKGKTTIAQMVAFLLHRAGLPAGYIGTNGITFAGKHFPSVNSTPESLVIYQYLRFMLEEGIHICVMEVSSQALWTHRVRGLTFSICLFTNLSPDHIGKTEHPTYAHYAASKHSLFTDYHAELVICNADDPAAPDMMQNVSARIEYISTAVTPDKPSASGLPWEEIRWRASHLTPVQHHGRLGVQFTCDSEGQDNQHIRFLPLPGIFNVQNALGALAICHHGFGLDVETIWRDLKEVTVPGRFETVTSPQCPGVTFIIDYAHNGVSLASTLDALRAFHPTRLICLFGSVGGRTVGRRKDLALAAAHRADLCILTSDNPGPEAPMQIIQEIDAAFPADSCPRVLIEDRAEAISYAVSIARYGDIFLLAGKGHETYQLVGPRMIPFSDRQTLEDALQTAHSMTTT